MSAVSINFTETLQKTDWDVACLPYKYLKSMKMVTRIVHCRHSYHSSHFRWYQNTKPSWNSPPLVFCVIKYGLLNIWSAGWKSTWLEHNESERRASLQGVVFRDDRAFNNRAVGTYDLKNKCYYGQCNLSNKTLLRQKHKGSLVGWQRLSIKNK